MDESTKKRKSDDLVIPADPAVIDQTAFVAAAERALAHGESRAAVLIDLDGEGVGQPSDAVVAAAEARLARAIRPDDLLARLDDGRLAVLTEADGAARVAIRMGGRLREPFDVGGELVHLIPQVGVGYPDGDVLTAAALLRVAANSPRY